MCDNVNSTVKPGANLGINLLTQAQKNAIINQVNLKKLLMRAKP